MPKWTRAGIIRDILQREADGRPLTASAEDGGIDHVMYQAASRIFGSWRNAVLAAGLPASRSRSNAEWTPARIRRLIRSMARRNKSLRAKALQVKHGSFLQAARRCFGSWANAIAASGIDPQQMKRVPSWTKERVIEHILLLSLRDQSLDRRFVQPRALVDAATQLFGSWKAAVTAAGVQPEIRQIDPPLNHSHTPNAKMPNSDHVRGTRWSNDQVLEHIWRRVRAGQSIRAVDVIGEHNGLFAAGARRFGNWRNTLIAAGLQKETP